MPRVRIGKMANRSRKSKSVEAFRNLHDELAPLIGGTDPLHERLATNSLARVCFLIVLQAREAAVPFVCLLHECASTYRAALDRCGQAFPKARQFREFELEGDYYTSAHEAAF